MSKINHPNIMVIDQVSFNPTCEHPNHVSIQAYEHPSYVHLVENGYVECKE